MQRILIIVIIVWASVCYAQYKTLPDSAANWLKVEPQPNFQPPIYFEYYLNDFKDDTLINGKEYIKLYGGSGTFKKVFVYYRSLPSGETYFIFKGDTTQTERLLLDFSKNVGDTIYNVHIGGGYDYNINYNRTYIVDSVSYLVHNGDSSKLMFLKIANLDSVWCDNATLIWLEGVGCLGWNFFNWQCVGCGWFMPLSCMSKNDTIMYKGYCQSNGFNQHQLDFYTSQMYVPGRCSTPPQIIKEEEIINKIKLYPNPVTNLLNIEELPLGKNSIHIINMMGGEVYQTEITGQTQASIHLGHLRSGLYVLFIKNESGLMFKHKLLKE